MTKVSIEGGTRNFGIGKTCFDGGGGEVYPFMGMVPLSTHIPDIGQPWSNLLLDSQSFGQGGGGYRSFRQCPVVLLLLLPPINGEGGGVGVIIGKYLYSLFTCFCAYRSF